MKKIIYFPISLFIFLIGCNQNDHQSEIILETTGFADSTIIYLVDTEKEITVDTGYIINNNLVFSAEVDEPTRFLIRPVIKKRKDIDYKHFWKENKQLTIRAEKGNLKNARIDGNLVGLNNFDNKYILLEFWGSGCGPCRMENPNLLKNYKAYRDKGFEIVSISLDKKRENWENAVKKDSMIWTTVSDLKGYDGDVAITYSIYFIPTNYLIDTNGLIIAKNLRGEKLGEKLKEIFPGTL